MPKVWVTTREGERIAIEAKAGATLMQAIRDGGIGELLALCGGSCACATCHVYVDPAHLALLSPMHGDEDAMLEGSAHRREDSRLSCQVRIDGSLDGLTVTIAPED